MSLRAMALGLSLVVATVAQAGVNVRLAPRDPGPFPPSEPGLTGSRVRVDIFLSQDTTGPRLVRLVQFDFNATSAELVLDTPFTATLGGPVADDLRFWVFDSLALCAGDSTMCSAGHLIDGTLDDTRPPGVKTTYMAFGSETELGTNPTLQVELPADGSEVRIGEVIVIFPNGIADGTYTLDVVNTAAASGDAGAQVHWGFGANIAPNNIPITRLKATTPGDVTGGTVELVVGDPKAVLTSSDPACGVSWPRSANNFAMLTFDGDLMAPGVGEVEVRELLATGAFGADLSTNFTFSIVNDGGGLPRILRVVENGTQLTDRTWYAIIDNGWANVDPFEVDIVHLIGDENGDGRVLSSDVVNINSSISFSLVTDSRRDINGDNRVLSADVISANGRIQFATVPKPDGHACVPTLP